MRFVVETTGVVVDHRADQPEAESRPVGELRRLPVGGDADEFVLRDARTVVGAPDGDGVIALRAGDVDSGRVGVSAFGGGVVG
jgi:hypothetical protein